MTKEEIRDWDLEEHEVNELTDDEFNHVVNCLKSIWNWYEHGYHPGSFITAMIKNNFIVACGAADNVNVKVLSLYAKFIYNCLPCDYKDKAKSL